MNRSKELRWYYLAIVLCTGIFLVGCGSNTTIQPCSASCTPQTQQFLYTLGPNTISTLSVAANGLPTLLNSETGPSNPAGMVEDSSGKYLYIPSVSYVSDSLVYGFSIDSTTGSLTGIANSPFDFALQFPIGNVVSNSQFLYMSAFEAGVIEFKVDPSSGGLTVGGAFSEIQPEDDPWEVSIDPSGRFVYQITSGGDLIPQHEIDAWTIPASGTLVPITNAPFVIPENFGGPMAFGAAGKYLYGTDTSSGIWAFSIDPNSGALTQIPSSPLATDPIPYDIVTDPEGKFLFASNQGDNTVSVFAIDANSGLLTPVSGSPFGTESTPAGRLLVDPSGEFLYLASADAGGLSVLSIDTTSGALKPMDGSPFFAGQSFTYLCFQTCHGVE